MESVATVGNDVRFLARQPEAEAERLEADGALLFVLGVVAGYDWHWRGNHGGEGVDLARGGVEVLVGDAGYLLVRAGVVGADGVGRVKRGRGGDAGGALA